MAGTTPGRPATARSVVDYGLARRALLTGLATRRLSALDACDAHPYLLRAARHHGEPSGARCPVCRCDKPLMLVTYLYGDELGNASGRARTSRELAVLAQQYSALDVYVVEVCQSCAWNHLTTSFVIGTGASVQRRSSARRAQRRTADT